MDKLVFVAKKSNSSSLRVRVCPEYFRELREQPSSSFRLHLGSDGELRESQSPIFTSRAEVCGWILWCHLYPLIKTCSVLCKVSFPMSGLLTSPTPIWKRTGGVAWLKSFSNLPRMCPKSRHAHAFLYGILVCVCAINLCVLHVISTSVSISYFSTSTFWVLSWAFIRLCFFTSVFLPPKLDTDMTHAKHRAS